MKKELAEPKKKKINYVKMENSLFNQLESMRLFKYASTMKKFFFFFCRGRLKETFSNVLSISLSPSSTE